MHPTRYPPASGASALVLETRMAPRKAAATKDKAKAVKRVSKATARLKLVWRKRDDQDSQLYNLKLDINDIKQEIARLASLRSIVQSRVLNRHDGKDGSSQKMVLQYFEVFAKGFAASPYDAVSYIYHAMAENIQVNNFSGRAMVVEQWKMHSATFQGLDFRFVSALVLPLSATRAIVQCTAHFHTTITLQTLACLFPHILQRQEIVQQLVGKPLSNFGQYDFEIDAASQQITRCDVVMDLFSCFAKLLPDVRQLAVLFGQSLLMDEFYICGGDVPVPQIPRRRSSIGELVISVNNASPVGSATCESEFVGATPTLAESKMRLDRILNAEEPLAEWKATSEQPGEAF